MSERPLITPHMTPIERQLYLDGHTEECQGFTIVPKRDFGQHGYWVPEYRANLNAGWVVLYGSGTYRGALATPGATFAWTLQGARELVADMIAAGYSGRCDECGDSGNSDEFWRINHARHAARREAEAAREAEVQA